FRKRGEKSLLVEIDIKSSASMTKLDRGKSVKIVQGPFSIECKPDKSVKSSGLELIVKDPPLVFFTDHRLYCSFVMKSKEGKKTIKEIFKPL
ncbi:hypothetical protein PMAYCL1PPCAC_18848, partial [Pristionchus mayeri]